MPQPQTTHKDLHRAALRPVLSLIYLLLILPAYAESPPHTASANPAANTQPKLAKNEPAQQPVNASVKPMAAPTKAVPVPQVKAPAIMTKGGKLREIPSATLNADTANAKSATDAKAAQNTKDTKDSKDTKEARASDKSAKSKISKEESKSTAEKSTGAKSSNKTAAVRRSKTAHSTPKLNNGLVPPPPPIVPIGMDALAVYGASVDFLSLKELEGRKKELTARFNELDSIVRDGERQIRERKERAELFESLYQEGVVSRKELETAKREAGEIDRDLKFKQDELDSVKVSMKAVNNRLAVLKKMEAKLNPGKKNNSPAAKSAKKR